MYVDYQCHTHFRDDESAFFARLGKALDFRDEELAMNQEGRLATPQMIRLALRGLAPFVAMLVSLAGLCVLAAGVAILGPEIGTKVRMLLFLGKYLMLGIGALFFGLVAFVIKFFLASGRAFRLIHDLAEGAVTSTSGRLTTSHHSDVEDGLSTITRQRSDSYAYVVKGESFEVSEDAWEAMRERDGGRYKLWITPRSRYLVAIEAASATDGGGRDPFTLDYNNAG